MSRSGYHDDLDNWELIRWRGAVASAIHGARGQRLLKDTLAALDAMPVKRLIKGNLEADGSYCALGALGNARGIRLDELEPEDFISVAECLDAAPALVREIAYENDAFRETPEACWLRMRDWVAERIR